MATVVAMNIDVAGLTKKMVAKRKKNESKEVKDFNNLVKMTKTYIEGINNTFYKQATDLIKVLLNMQINKLPDGLSDFNDNTKGKIGFCVSGENIGINVWTMRTTNDALRSVTLGFNGKQLQFVHEKNRYDALEWINEHGKKEYEDAIRVYNELLQAFIDQFCRWRDSYLEFVNKQL